MKPGTLALVLALSWPALSFAQQPLRRFALLIGDNDGGSGRTTLRYAQSDARAVGRVLHDLGGVSPADEQYVLDGDRDAVVSALAGLQKDVARAIAAGSRVEAIVYYSGHSDETGLLLKGERLPYGELRDALERIPATVRIAVLDSCDSGVFTRLKGGAHRPAFLVDSSVQLAGHASLTSSSADEASQESDAIGGSYFTGNLVAALRGAADTNQDRRVTLTEAYQYAFEQTLARTANAQGGAQHPSYNIQLAGTGDLVMTDLRTTAAELVVGPKLEGVITIRNGRGDLVIELRKAGGRTTELGLEPGTYAVVAETARELRKATVELQNGKRTELKVEDLGAAERMVTVTRGLEQRSLALDLSLVPPLSLGALLGRPINVAAGVGLVAAYADNVSLFQFSSAAGVVGTSLNGVQLSGGVNVVGEELAGVQLAGGGNVAPALRGAQIALVNVAGSASGAQVGLVNIARELHGTQVGLFNFARTNDGVPVGLVSLSRESEPRLWLWGNELTPGNVGASLKTGPVYSLLQAGTQPFAARTHFSLGLGLGLEQRLDERFRLAEDVSGLVLHAAGEGWANAPYQAQLRLLVVWQPLQHLGVVAGPTANLFFARSEQAALSFKLPAWSLSASSTVAFWPGVIAGLRF